MDDGRGPASREDDDRVRGDELLDPFDVRPRFVFGVSGCSETSVRCSWRKCCDSPEDSIFVSDILHLFVGTILEEEASLVFVFFESLCHQERVFVAFSMFDTTRS